MGQPMSEWGWLAEPVHGEAPVDGPAWRDNAWLAFWDPPARTFGIVHVSTSPNLGGRRARCSVTVGERATELIEPLEPGTFRSRSIDFDLDGKVVVDSPGLRLELVTRPRFVAGDYSASGVIPVLEAGFPLRHYQQGAVVTGHLVAGDVAVDIDGLGFRDRTWGPRNEAVQFVEWLGVEGCLCDFDLTAIRFRDSAGTITTHGFLLGPEAAVPVPRLSVTRDPAGLIDGLSLVAADGRAMTFELRRARGGFWLPMGDGGAPPSTLAYDDSVDFLLDGRVCGSGIAEQGAVHVL